MSTIAVIPAGGKGLRSGYTTPKQFVRAAGKEIIVHTLSVFQKNSLIDRIILAAEPVYFNFILRLIKKHRLTKVKLIVEGGDTRQQSVYNAVMASGAEAGDLIVVHDAARVMLPDHVLTEAVKAAEKYGSALVSIKARDTLIKGKGNVKEYLNRDEVYYAQTPQIFKFRDLHRALIKAHKENFVGTDESMLIRRTGKRVHLVEGSVFNFKITTKEDLLLLKKLLKQ